MKTYLISATFLLGSVCCAQITVSLSGFAGDPVVNYTVSGSVISPTSGNGANSGTTLLPQTSGVSGWDFVPDSVGHMIVDGVSDVTLPISSTIAMSQNGTTFGVADEVRLIANFEVSNNDRLRFGFSDYFVNYPTVTVGDTVSWSGSGTFTLTSGTFDTVFIPGFYSEDPSLYQVSVSTVAEPATAGSMLGLAALLLARRYA